MSACPSKDELEEVALGSGRPEPRAHAAACPDCAARVAWLRKEEEIVSRWAAQDGAPTAHLWEGVRRGIAGRRRRRRTAAGGFAAAVAAGVLVLLRPSAEAPDTTASATAAIDEAEAEYTRAIESLEAQVAARGTAQGQGGAIAQGRRSLQRARATSGRDPAGRVRLMEGYAAYLRSLRRALREER